MVHILTWHNVEMDALQANMGSGKEEIAVPREKEDDGMEEGRIGGMSGGQEDLQKFLDQIEVDNEDEAELTRKIEECEVLNELNAGEEELSKQESEKAVPSPKENAAEVTPLQFTGDVHSPSPHAAFGSLLPSPTPLPSSHSNVKLSELTSVTPSPRDSSPSVPDDQNTRLFLLSQQIASETPDVTLIRAILRYTPIPAIPEDYRRGVYCSLLGVFLSFFCETDFPGKSGAFGEHEVGESRGERRVDPRLCGAHIPAVFLRS